MRMGHSFSSHSIHNLHTQREECWVQEQMIVRMVPLAITSNDSLGECVLFISAIRSGMLPPRNATWDSYQLKLSSVGSFQDPVARDQWKGVTMLGGITDPDLGDFRTAITQSGKARICGAPRCSTWISLSMPPPVLLVKKKCYLYAD